MEDYAGTAAVKARAAKEGGDYHLELASDEEEDDLGPSLARRRVDLTWRSSDGRRPRLSVHSAASARFPVMRVAIYSRWGGQDSSIMPDIVPREVVWQAGDMEMSTVKWLGNHGGLTRRCAAGCTIDARSQS